MYFIGIELTNPNNNVHRFSNRPKRIVVMQAFINSICSEKRNHGNTNDQNQAFNVEHLINHEKC